MNDCIDMSTTCLTGAYQHPLNNYSMMGVPPPQINWQYPPFYQNNNVNLSTRRDSGIHSSSDGHVSSPSSEDSGQFSPQSHYSQYLSTPYRSHSVSPLQPSTPPIFPLTIKEEPGLSEDEKQDPSTPCDNSALKRLEKSVENNLNISSPGSPTQVARSDTSIEDCTQTEDYSLPSVNSHGKVKTVKCKQCQIVFKTKLEFWTHQRQHIKPDRLLECEKCPFVTEYKHHLEYHMRNHGGEKPYKCKECDYKCVNKSMLNSHMKSHSNIYQYRCASCHYSSKYCHSLKLHLRKYGHKPAMVLNPDGTPNPLPIIDVYGTRRGPKVKTDGENIRIPSPKKSRLENGMPQMPMPPVHPAMQGMMPLQMIAQDPEMQMKILLQQAFLMQSFQNLVNSGFPNPLAAVPQENANSPQEADNGGENAALDLSRASNVDNDNNNDNNNVKLVDTPSTTDDEEEDENLRLLYQVKVEHDVDDSPPEEQRPPTPPEAPPTEAEPASSPAAPGELLRCPHCSITFDDVALFTIHMRFHNFSNPFTCNSCGYKCANKIDFTVHIFSKPH